MPRKTYEQLWNVYYWADGNLHSILAQATDEAGNVGQSALISVTVSEDATALLVLVSPLDEVKFTNTDSVSFVWKTIADAMNYLIQLSLYDNFSIIEYADTLSDTTMLLKLTQGTHYWQVKAQNIDTVWGPWSDDRSFTIDGPIAPILINPSNDSVLSGADTCTFLWYSSQNAISYEIQLSSNSSFIDTQYTQIATDTTVSTLLPIGPHYWRVRAQNSVGFWGLWSDTLIFGTGVFVSTFGGANVDFGYCVKQTSDGGYIIVGKTNSFGAGSYDVYLIKTNATGKHEWSKTFGGTGLDEGWYVQQTTDGGYIIAGKTSTPGLDTFYVYLIKTDTNGAEQWSKKFRDYRKNRGGKCVQQTIDGGYILLSESAYLIKTDNTGIEQWSKIYIDSTVISLEGSVVQKTLDGGYIIIGGCPLGPYLKKTDTIGDTLWTKYFTGMLLNGYYGQQTTDGGYLIVGQGGSGAAGIIKTDGNGNQEWVKHYSGTCNNRTGVQTSDGGYIVIAGTLLGSNHDVKLIKTNSNGDKMWSKPFGGPGIEVVRSIQQTTDGGYIFVGHIETSRGIDVWLIKTDSEGNTLFSQKASRN